MSNQPYLENVLWAQNLQQGELDQLVALRTQIEGQLSVFQGQPRFYYGGSYGKDTLIRASYDLDIVMYWPHDCGYTLEGMFTAVRDQLRKHWAYVNPKNVALRLPFEGAFHIDVVPGRALDTSFRYANLYRSETGQPLQTSIKVHIDAVRKSGRRELIRLMKLWKFRYQVPIRSFVLEQLAIAGANGTSFTELEPQLTAALVYIRDHVGTSRIVDPANTNNDLGETINVQERAATRAAAVAAISARTWGEVFG
jgi:hypothetical protein